MLYIFATVLLAGTAHSLTLDEEFAVAQSYETEARKNNGRLSLAQQRRLFKEYLDLANRGHACAHEKVSWYFVTGNVPSQSFPKAFAHASKALHMGCDDALYTLGYFYETSTGVEKDLKNAFDYYLRSAEKGNVTSAYRVFAIYRDGNEAVGKDLLEAYKWLTYAANHGSHEARKSMESCNYNGLFCESHLDIRY